MNINTKSLIWELSVLGILLAAPILFAIRYQKMNLGVVEYEQSTLDKISLYQDNITKTLQYLHLQKQQQLSKLYTNNPSFNQSDRIALQNELSRKIESNSWVAAFSNIKKLNIINIVIHLQHEGDRPKMEKRIMKALEWFSIFYSMNLSFLKWNNTITFDQIPSNTVLVIFQQFRNELVEENIAGRLKTGQYNNQFYIKEVVKQIRSTPMFSHCKYTNQSCQQKTVLVMPQHPSFEDCFLNIQNQFYIISKLDKTTLFQLVANLLDVYQFQQLKSNVNASEVQILELHALVKNISYLRESQKILRYIKFIMDPIQNSRQKMVELFERSYQQLYQYLLHGKYKSPYIHNAEEKQIVLQLLQLINNKLQDTTKDQRLQMDILTDTRVGKIDIFANNFKVGVYLPLFVLFFYPVFIKLKDLLEYAFRKIKGSFKKQQTKGLKQE